MSLWDKLPHDIIQHIYEYDTTYRENMNESLKFIEHACPSCCCDGREKNRYRHHFDIGTFPYTFWDWEWRRRNACPKHNPEDFDKDGNQTEYNWRDADYYNRMNNMHQYMQQALTTTHYHHHTIVYEPYFTIWRADSNATINYSIIMMSLCMYCIRNQNIYPSPIKTYSRKKLSGARFMDMTHDQRPIAA
jgi:hypothetical protein